jgi:hypothetical protein
VGLTIEHDALRFEGRSWILGFSAPPRNTAFNMRWSCPGKVQNDTFGDTCNHPTLRKRQRSKTSFRVTRPNQTKFLSFQSTVPGTVIGSSTMNLSAHQACYFAHELTKLGEVGEFDRLSTTLFDSKVDLNPHQVDAALFAMANPLQKGVVLADEVGLGKTIEAGLVLCQKWAERRRKLAVVSPAHIRKQWQLEFTEKFNLPTIVMDRKIWSQFRRDGHPNPFDCGKIIVISYGFASRMKEELRAVPFDLVVMDEAHKLRNAYQPSRKGGQAIRWAFELRQKILLTATPLQNTLLELYGLGWVIGDHVFGDTTPAQNS